MSYARIAIIAVLCVPALSAQTSPGNPEAVHLLQANCSPCHGGRTRSGGLSLDSREDLLAGSNRGPAVKAGAPAESLLLQAIEQKGDLKMPPGRRLTDEQIATIRTWIEQGMVWPEPVKDQTQKKKGADHWSFQPPRAVSPPEVKTAGWDANPIDRFVAAKLEKENVRPSPEADRDTLLRRVSLDLTGLPPSPREIEAFRADTAPAAYEKVVNRLLASPHYGERWGRHWLDLARYADSDGYTLDEPRPIWRYRDWVVQALNRDQPFDQFVIEQIAGDLLPNPTIDQLIATGFHRNTPINVEGGIDFEQYRNEAVADRVATTGAALLGLTLGCARCHDHKYDPISQREFYQIFAYFNSTDEITTEAERSDFRRPVLEVPTPEEEKALADYRKNFAAQNAEFVNYVRTLAAKPVVDGDPPKHRDARLLELQDKMRTLRRQRPFVTSTLIMRELPQPRESYIHLGGDFTRKGATVQPAAPAAIAPKLTGGNRLDFARWLVDRNNPLTARVTVNRVWQAYFGKGLVETEDDFGAMGSRPTHPELLDWLAVRFMEGGWSLKKIHRLIVTSAVYRQSSRVRPDLEERDPGNTLLARQSRFRAEAEIIRDAALAASGLLNPALGGPGVYPPIASGGMQGTQVQKAWPTAFGPDRYRRGLYTFRFRSPLHPALGLFDTPDAAAACTRRVRSDSPLQALTLLNDTAFVEAARAFAGRILHEGGATDPSRIEFGFLAALGRKPSVAEADRLARFLALQRDEFQTDPQSAVLMIGGGGDPRAIREAEEAAGGQAAGTQSAEGRAAAERSVARGKIEVAAAKADAEKRAAEIAAMDRKQAGELAAWTALSRVLFNLDDFINRN
jgi:mono/diheme cytochrome c family protein